MNQANVRADPATIVIWGASGDLTQRKLIPALHSLGREGLLPDVRVVGVARTRFSDQDFRARIYEGVVEYARLNPGVCELWPRFAGRLSDDPLGRLTLREAVLVEGEEAQTNTLRWMDYSQTAVDPSDDRTIWYVGDYIRKGAESYSTRIGGFQIR